jgi:hypothetical protein
MAENVGSTTIHVIVAEFPWQRGSIVIAFVTLSQNYLL